MKDRLLEKLDKVLEILLNRRSTESELLSHKKLLEKDLLTNNDVCAIFQVSSRTTHRWRRTKGFISIEIGTRVYYLPEDVINFLQSRYNLLNDE